MGIVVSVQANTISKEIAEQERIDNESEDEEDKTYRLANYVENIVKIYEMTA